MKENSKMPDVMESIVLLYESVTGKTASFGQLIEQAISLKIHEPLVQSSAHLGKFPMHDHILDDDISESPFSL